MLSVFHLQDGSLRTGLSATEVAAALSSGGALWIDLEAPTADEKAFLQGLFPGHPLAVEDCISPSKTPKLNVHGDLVHLVIHGSSPPAEHGRLHTRELDALWGERVLVTYHPHPLRSVNALRERCPREPTAILGQGPVHTLYQVLDILVDNWFPFLDAASKRLGQLESRIVKDPKGTFLEDLQGLGRDLLALTLVIDPQREVLNRLSRDEVPGLPPGLRPYFRDLYDRAVVLHGSLDLYREQVRSARESYLLIVSNNLNQVMKVLTVVSTVLMTMSLVTGIYGMNFQHMPELAWRWGYPATLAGMLTLGGLVFLWMRKKDWI